MQNLIVLTLLLAFASTAEAKLPFSPLDCEIKKVFNLIKTRTFKRVPALNDKISLVPFSKKSAALTIGHSYKKIAAKKIEQNNNGYAQETRLPVDGSKIRFDLKKDLRTGYLWQERRGRQIKLAKIQCI